MGAISPMRIKSPFLFACVILPAPRLSFDVHPAAQKRPVRPTQFHGFKGTDSQGSEPLSRLCLSKSGARRTRIVDSGAGLYCGGHNRITRRGARAIDFSLEMDGN